MNIVGNTPVLKGRLLKSVFSNPFHVSGAYITVLCKRHNTRYSAFTVKKHTVRTKVQRNYLKRIMREAYRITEDDYPDKGLFFFIGKRDPNDIEFSSLIEEFRELGKRINEIY